MFGCFVDWFFYFGGEGGGGGGGGMFGGYVCLFVRLRFRVCLGLVLVLLLSGKGWEGGGGYLLSLKHANSISGGSDETV